MKISKRKFKIKKYGDGYTIYFCGAPVDRNGFPTRKAARRRLNEYIKRVNQHL